MQYKNHIVISDVNSNEEYVHDTFNEELSTPDYEAIDVDLVATEIARKIVDRLNKKDAIWDRELDSAIFMAVDNYLNDIRNKLTDNVGECVYNNLECKILNYRGE